jgi:NUMOD4 motif-containing protein
LAERWLPVPDWPYEVSDQVIVRSVERTVPDGRVAGSVILKPVRDGKGYLCVTLRDGFRRKEGPRAPPGQARPHRTAERQVRHKDDVKDNVTLANLKYETQKQNEQDKKRNQGHRPAVRGPRRRGPRLLPREPAQVPASAVPVGQGEGAAGPGHLAGVRPARALRRQGLEGQMGHADDREAITMMAWLVLALPVVAGVVVTLTAVWFVWSARRLWIYGEP